MKKITFVIGTLSMGGAERMVSNLANSLSKNNDVNVSIIIFDNVIDYEMNSNINIVSLDYRKDKLNKIKKILRLRRAIKRIDPDTIVCFLEHVCMATIYATRFTKYSNRVITTIRNNPNYSKYSYKYQLNFLSKSYKCIFQNTGERKCFPKISDDKSIIIPNYYNSKFENNNRKCNDRVKKIISVGRLEEQKNFKLLIDAIDKIDDKNVKLDIVGKGSLKDELNQYIVSKKLENRITIIDWSKNVKELLDNADLFVMSSKYEGMPNALMEAMVSGIPCISTDCDFGPSDLIIHNQNGLLSKDNDLNDLIKNINYAINNYDKMTEMSRNAINYMKGNFSEEIVLSKWYDAILEE